MYGGAFRNLSIGERRQLNVVTDKIIGAAMRVHDALGPGLLESAYQACLAYELKKHLLAVEKEVPVPVVYDEVHLECGYRMDLLVERRVVVELKAVQTMPPIFEAQLLSHMKLAGKPLGLLMNFHVLRLRDGLKRLVI